MSGYSKTAWANGAAPAISADNLGKLETADEQALGLDTIAALRALPVPTFATRAWIRGHSQTLDGGGGAFDWDSSCSDADDDGITINPTGHVGVGRWVRNYNGDIYVNWFGAKKDSTSDSTGAIQAAINTAAAVKKAVIFDDGGGGGGQYIVHSTLSIPSRLSLYGAGGSPVAILFEGCSGFSFAEGAGSKVVIANLSLSQRVRHTDTPNSYEAMRFNGSASNPANTVKITDVQIIGFGIAIRALNIWNLYLNNSRTDYCGRALDVSGASTNNIVSDCRFVEGGGETAIRIGGGSLAFEGWLIEACIFTKYKTCMDGIGLRYSKFINNICDFISAGGAGILIRSSTDSPSIGNTISGNYLAASAASTHGIRLVNNMAPKGNDIGSEMNVISNNLIKTYTGGSIGIGISIDGSEEKDLLVSGNNVKANRCLECKATGATIVDNDWIDGDATLFEQTIYTNNTKGVLLTSEVLVYRTFGDREEQISSGIPTSGSFNAGDLITNVTPFIRGDSTVLEGWLRVTTGSNNVLGVDWVERIITVP